MYAHNTKNRISRDHGSCRMAKDLCAGGVFFRSIASGDPGCFRLEEQSFVYVSENGFSDLITINSPYDEEVILNAKNIPIKNILINLHDSGLKGTREKKLKYIYDYGDQWEHEIATENVEDLSIDRPELLNGGGTCPPEDCMGIPGFMDIKKDMATGVISELRGESWVPWLEAIGYRNYDPQIFDLEAARQLVKKLG
jgi:hypothetical protein